MYIYKSQRDKREDVEEQEEGLWMICVCELEQGTVKEMRKNKTSEITIGFLVCTLHMRIRAHKMSV